MAMAAKHKQLLSLDPLETYRNQTYSCTRCAVCAAVCPTYLSTGEEPLSARGRLSLIEAVLDGRQDLSRGLSQHLSQCLLCGACADACPAGINIPEIILAARECLAIADRHWLTLPDRDTLALTAARKLAGSQSSRSGRRLLKAGGALYRHLPARRFLPWSRAGRNRSFPNPVSHPLDTMIPEISSPRLDPEKTRRQAPGATRRIALFPGCAAGLTYQQTAIAAVKVLNHSGVEVIMPRGLSCCGLPLRSLGDPRTAASLARRNLLMLNNHAIDEIVTICSSCALALKQEAAKLPEPPVVLDIHELLPAINLPPQTGSPETLRVAWHDPCHLGRGLGLTREPRKIIAELPGVEYVEAGMLSCCGGGGAFSLMHYDLALGIGMARAEALAATGAEVIATGCPGCRAQLEDMLNRLGSTTRVVHTVELLENPAKAGRLEQA